MANPQKSVENVSVKPEMGNSPDFHSGNLSRRMRARFPRYPFVNRLCIFPRDLVVKRFPTPTQPAVIIPKNPLRACSAPVATIDKESFWFFLSLFSPESSQRAAAKWFIVIYNGNKEGSNNTWLLFSEAFLRQLKMFHAVVSNLLTSRCSVRFVFH